MGSEVLEIAVAAGLVVAATMTLLAAYRVIMGPTTPDRVVALDTISTNVVAIAVLFAIQTRESVFLSAGVVLAIIGFVSTVTVAKYVVEGDIIQK
ncbi:MAG: monovalent cation/H+ antiporter complex subunit F [Halanaeroarchaeum sp.]